MFFHETSLLLQTSLCSVWLEELGINGLRPERSALIFLACDVLKVLPPNQLCSAMVQQETVQELQPMPSEILTPQPGIFLMPVSIKMGDKIWKLLFSPPLLATKTSSSAVQSIHKILQTSSPLPKYLLVVDNPTCVSRGRWLVHLPLQACTFLFTWLLMGVTALKTPKLGLEVPRDFFNFCKFFKREPDGSFKRKKKRGELQQRD